MRHLILATITLVLLFSCGQRKEKKNHIELTNAPEFSLPSIPTYLTDREEKMNYVVKHYWKTFNFQDTTWLNKKDKMEQIFADYLTFLFQCNENVGSKSIDSLFVKLSQEPNMLRYFIDLSEKYLHEPNSPYRNETYHISVLRNILNSQVLTEDEKIRPEYIYDLAQKNRPGMFASNFNYTNISGKNKSLYDIKSEYLLLLFINPDCEACKEIVATLDENNKLCEMIKSKQVKVLTIYVDEEIELWKKQIKTYPNGWLHGYDQTLTMRTNTKYNLNAIPTLYLLDQDKKVILKDAIPMQLIDTINNL